MIKSKLSGSMFVLISALAAQAATVSGVVTTGSRGGTAPVAEAKVVLMGFGGGPNGQQRLDSTTTNAQGRYTFEDVTTGARVVTASKAGYEDGVGAAQVASANGSYTVNITLVPSGDSEVGVVAGTVRAAGTNGAAISGALVTIARPTGTGGPVDSARTNAQGRYVFDSVPALNNYVVRVAASGYTPNSNSNVDVNAGDTTIANFTMTPLPEVPKPGSIAGTVRKQSNGDVFWDAVVILSRVGTSFRDTVKTNTDGLYSFDSVPPAANYTVTVAVSGYQTASNADVDVVSGQTTTIDFNLLPIGGTVSRGSIIGTVKDRDKKAIAKARVILSRTGTAGGAGPIDTVETDSTGDYVLEGVVALENYTVTVTATGYQTAVNNNVDVKADQATLADFVLVPTGGSSIQAAARSDRDLRVSAARGGSLALDFGASPWAGRLSAYDARGALALSLSIPAGASRVELPARAGVRVLVLERGGMVERLALPVAR